MKNDFFFNFDSQQDVIFPERSFSEILLQNKIK